MNKIEGVENQNTFFDFLWYHIRGFLFIILTFITISATINMAIYYNTEIVKSEIESLKYCPHCGQDLSH